MQFQEELFPRDQIFAFEAADAAVAADLYRRLRRPCGRELDLAIAAMTLTRDATLWTFNAGDFSDIPDLRLL